MNFKQCWNLNRENKQIVSAILYQKPSNVLLYIFLKLGISATTVSFLMLFVSIVGVILMFIPTKLTLILGVLCFVFAIILDILMGILPG